MALIQTGGESTLNPILEVQNLGVKYSNSRYILKDINFKLNQGEVLSIIGPNGVGKSTLLNCLTRSLEPTDGSIIVFGKDIEKIKTADFAKIVGYMRQSTDIVYDYSVFDVVLMGRAPYISAYRQPSEEDKQIALDAMKSMGVYDFAERSFSELSGGEKQKVLITRIVVQSTPIIIMDEPTSALDYGNQIKTISEIKKLQSKGFTVIMTTHNPDHALSIGGKVAALGRENKFVFGNSEDILTTDTLSELYGEKICVSYVEEFGRKVCVCV